MTLLRSGTPNVQSECETNQSQKPCQAKRPVEGGLCVNSPSPSSVNSPFSYSSQNGDLNDGYFVFGSEQLHLFSTTVSLAAARPAWTMMILGFAGRLHEVSARRDTIASACSLNRSIRDFRDRLRAVFSFVAYEPAHISAANIAVEAGFDNN
jgi:hypothetical protein